MTLDLRHVELFVRVATLGAIGRAGAELGLSTTNASQRIQALEEDLGVKLLHRTTRAVSLTADGELFLDHAMRLLDDVEDAKDALSPAGRIKGVLRVAASASFGRSHIVPYVPDFLAAFPEVRLELHFSDTFVDLVEEGCDLAFRLGELAPSTLLAQKVDDHPMKLVASPAYLERRGAPSTPEDLVHHTCIPFGRSRTWSFEGEDGSQHEVPVSGPVRVNLGDAIGQWVVAGLGIGQAPLWHAGPDLRAGRLVTVLPGYRVRPETRIWAVRPPGRVMPRRVKAFLDFMQTRIRETNRTLYADLL